MADSPTVTTPSFTGVVNQQFFVEPLGGPQNPKNYLDRFPDTVYNKGIDSHLVKLMYALIGPAGSGWLRKNYLQARLIIEQHGLSTFDLDAFYGDPFAFGRILEETYDEDPNGLLPRSEWDAIKAKDAQYRNRAIDFLNAARAGTTNLGIQLAAKSGLGQDVDVFENYKTLWNNLSDDPIDIDNFGVTDLMGEAIIVPRRDTSNSALQVISISGNPTGGTFTLGYPYGRSSQIISHTNEVQILNVWATGGTWNLSGTMGGGFSLTNIPYNITASALMAMTGFPSFITVSGGPASSATLYLTFGGTVAGTNVPLVTADGLNLNMPGYATPREYIQGGQPVYDSGNYPTTSNLAYNALAIDVQAALESLDPIGEGNVQVTGGPLPNNPINIRFTNKLANQNVQILRATSSLTGGTSPQIINDVQLGGIQSSDEAVGVSPHDMRYLQSAVDRIRPVTMFPTYGIGMGIHTRLNWQTILATSEFTDVVRYVTGTTNVSWPSVDNIHWIEPEIEHEAPRAYDEQRQHYQGFHNINSIISYTESALEDPDYLADNWLDVIDNYRDNHIGPYSQLQSSLFPILGITDNPEFLPDRAIADYNEILTIQTIIDNDTTSASMINGIYPVDYQSLPGVPPLRYSGDHFWSSKERAEGDDYLEIDLGKVQAVNFISFDATKKPYDIEVQYDVLDNGPSRLFVPVTLEPFISSTTAVGFSVGDTNPWSQAAIYFTNSIGNIIFTRYIRIKFARRLGGNSPFNDSDGDPLDYSIEIRNLRLGRNVA